ncbi:MAG: GNAT family N-acetyltransferase [Bdellovibrionaceae bacterium]|nr:GNAT family N-acetyltransferase [Pseudobdellovibrionaceae bacterium]
MSEKSADLRVVTYDPQYLPAFIALNREWIEKFFKIESNDVLQLENAETAILQRGGEILFILDGAEAIGTCAMIPHGESEYELAKMAVSPKAQGRGAGDLLMRAAIGWARERGAREVVLISNTLLTPAIALYKKHGFETTRLGPHPDYERGDIEMRLRL